MIAINIPRKRIIFHHGQTDDDKITLLWDLWWNNEMLLHYICPVTAHEKDIPDVLEFQFDENYGPC